MLLHDLKARLRRNARRLDRLAARMPVTEDRIAAYRADPARIMTDAGLSPDPWQETLLRSTDPRVLLLCSRQVGKSTGTAVKAEAVAITVPGSTVTITAPTESQANELLRKVLLIHNAIGRPVALTREAVTYLEYANGSRVLALPGKESRMRSYTADLLIIDEAARVSDDVLNAASPTLAVSRGRLVALSTAFAKSGFFYREWTEGEGYLRLSVTARECPRIPREFLAEERRKLGPRWYAMEYENEFGDDIAAVFSTEDIRAALSPDVQPLFPSHSSDMLAGGITPLFGGTA